MPYPPCRDVTATKVTIFGNKYYISHKVYDPWLKQEMTGDSLVRRPGANPIAGGYYDEVSSLFQKDGIVFAILGNNQDSSDYAYLSVYDPLRPNWENKWESNTTNLQIRGGKEYDCADGIVVMSNCETGYLNDTIRMWAKTYDPQRGQWVEFYREEVGSRNLRCSPQVKDGIAFFKLIHEGTGAYINDILNIKIIWAIYDPRDGLWHDMQFEDGHAPREDSFYIDGASVYCNNTIWGYDSVGIRTWLPIPTKPLANFIMDPASGRPPLNVLIWDMSLGCSRWEMDFDEGQGVDFDFRSGFHAYKNPDGGTYTVTKKVRNSFWEATPATQTVQVEDISLPVGTFTINDGAKYTFYSIVSLKYSATGMEPGSKVRFRNDPGRWQAKDWFDYPDKPEDRKLSWPLLDPKIEGKKTIWAQFADDAGHLYTCAQSITLDNTGPIGSLIINGGDQYAVTDTLHLHLTASDSSGITSEDIIMKISDDKKPTDWMSFEPDIDWDVTDLPDGPITVSVEFRDLAGNWSKSIEDSIILDRYPPRDCLIIINGGAAFTNDRQVTLTLQAKDASPMEYRIGVVVPGIPRNRIVWQDSPGWKIFEVRNLNKPHVTHVRHVTYKLGEEQKPYEILAQFRDAQGRESEAVSSVISLDLTDPTGSISINNGAEFTNSRWVTIYIKGFSDTSGLGKLSLSNDKTQGWISGNVGGQQIQKGIPWELTKGDGKKTVYAIFTDKAGNTFECEDSIELKSSA
jgi:PKD repeat protein